MMPMHDSEPSPRLERLLRASARVSPGLSDRLVRASLPQLPRAETPVILWRFSWSRFAAAAALLLAAGLGLRWMAQPVEHEHPEYTLTMLVEGADESVLGEAIVNLNSVRGTGLDDLDAEMQLFLADARVDG